MEDKPMTLFEHLEALRKVIIISVIAIVIGSIIAYNYVDYFLNILLQPVTALKMKLVFINVTEAFMTKLKIAIILGIILASPIILWQIWSFVAPGLKPAERKFILRMIPVIIILFVAGIVFAFFTVFQIATRFLLQFGGDIMSPMITIGKYISFALNFLIPFGLVFELPVVVYILAKLNIISHEFLVKNRKYALLVVFILAAALTPGPDVISQLLMAAPLLILYEVSIFIAKFIKPKEFSGERK
ncbi:twin-arginine translocase subunit TatC [Carboxydothermus hydrogenoformans]|uniref:Sec-independent protein translocase protein TatC n=1 Tax=Carboxydothermus hydrogenoformans (strain ATCC BAA-161 / DSM 6008 / Z-2901) TaxID=246194 RepID=TATC_CARHZ|nr:twin-arginine translocase subunit TatC [Carboxydothermus hydrogenoformans]Q3ADS0.1 RecName: Full=Sec-independent protein translocase protein TatC [Carboxydothermus hydrogenoformans Z-2901]ABB14493.1 sec-independent protein translocase protein TatC [Carboxydothermus hydrogenoformans Z-2901]